MKVRKLFESDEVKELKKELLYFIKSIKSDYKNIDFGIMVEDKKLIHINFIGSNTFGDATKALSRLIDWADNKKITITLDVSDNCGSNYDNLLKGYSRFGFVLNPNKYSDKRMIREPR
jgi:aryl-phospho-beta-D-glucosidase BglC (GH1 family)